MSEWTSNGLLTTAFITFVAIMAASFALPIVAMLLFFPGRRGTMRTERQASHGGVTPADAWGLYAARLQYEGFEVAPPAPQGFQVAPGTLPSVLRATRRAKTALGSVAGVHAQSNKPLEAEATFQEIPGGAAVTMALWTTDYVICDTGEGRYIDGVLDRLMTAELSSAPPVIVPCPSFSPVKALVVAALVWLGVAAMWLPFLAPAVVRGMGIGLAVSALVGVVSAVHGLIEIRAKPAELYGTGRAVAAMVLLVLGVAAAGGTLAARASAVEGPDPGAEVEAAAPIDAAW
jgi:hypothetical protein